MKIKKLIKRVKWQVQECIDCDGDKECFMDLASWKPKMGVLLTPNEVLRLINEIESLTKFIKDYIKDEKENIFDKSVEDCKNSLLNLKNEK